MTLHHYYDRHSKTLVRRVLPGDYVAFGPQMIAAHVQNAVTVLGSCIAVCLFDVEAKVCGLNHFMLPHADQDCQVGEPDQSREVSARYGANAMELLINALLHQGAKRGQLRAHVFGGSQLLQAQSSIGKLNQEFAISYLRSERISIREQDCGGKLARKLYLFPSELRVECQTLPKSQFGLEANEQQYKRQLLADVGRKADIVLF